MLFMTNVPLPSIMDPKYVTNSGQKETYRILFLSETFNPWNSLSSSAIFTSSESYFFPCFPRILGDSRLVRLPPHHEFYLFVEPLSHIWGAVSRDKEDSDQGAISRIFQYTKERDVQAAAVKFSHQFKEEQ